MEEQGKYSAMVNQRVITFLSSNGIAFVYRKGFQTGKYRIFFMADAETADIVREVTKCTVFEEEDGWDFEGWDGIAKRQKA